MTTTTDLLTGPQTLNADIVAGDDFAFAPHAASATGIGKIELQTRIACQLRLDRLNQQGGLRVYVADLEHVSLEAPDNTVQRKSERQVRRF